MTDDEQQDAGTDTETENQNQPASGDGGDDGGGEGEGDNPAADRAGITEKPPPEEIEQIEKEREERLDPDNRPENAEVDNTQRTFDGEHFKD